MDIDLQKVKTSRDALEAGLPVFKVFSDGAVKAYKDNKGVRRFSLTASSDADDLVGDFFAEKALKRMESAAPGTTMFLNHQYSVPEDVFGSVEKATLVKREIAFQGGEKRQVLCLDYDGIVEESNERALKTHDMMMAERVRLGGSISVLITEKSNTKDGRRRIEDVYYLECSVVGIPCNPTAWVQSASKALDLSSKSRGNLIVSAPEMEYIRSAPRMAERLVEITPFIEALAQRGESIPVSVSNTLHEAVDLVRLHETLERERITLVLA